VAVVVLALGLAWWFFPLSDRLDYWVIFALGFVLSIPVLVELSDLPRRLMRCQKCGRRKLRYGRRHPQFPSVSSAFYFCQSCGARWSHEPVDGTWADASAVEYDELFAVDER
jgi:hypothetical protein